jgi:hypothetical protein
MLPLVQMHHMVQPSQNFESRSSYPSPNQPDYTFNHHISRLSRDANTLFTHEQTHRAFAIRTSEATQSIHRRATASLTSSFDDLPEHRLRRKTPNGTLDAGYDGSLAPLAPGPPPLKHVILPVSSMAFAPNPVLRNTDTAEHNYIPQMPASEGSQAQNLDGSFESFRPRASIYCQWPAIQDGAAQPAGVFLNQPTMYHPSLSMYTPNNVQETPGLLRTAYQANIGTNAFNGRAFCPLPTSLGDIRCDPHLPLQASIPVFTPRGVEYSQAVFSRRGLVSSHPQNYMFTKSAVHPLPAQSHFIPSPLASRGAFNQAVTNHSHINLDTLTLDPSGATDFRTLPVEFSSTSRFIEKALAQAHSTYMDLLTYLYHYRKGTQGKSGANSYSSSKILVYPKPPKPVAVQPRLLHDTPQHIRGLYHQPHYSLSAYDTIDSSGTHQPSSKLRGSVADLSNQAQLQRPTNALLLHPTPIQLTADQDKNSPVSRARKSLEVLNQICELSGWKWVDGILLGGCLQYGLERYEEALEWFSRVRSLDPK